MPFRTHHATLRRLCGLVLLAWVFGLLSGTVNACILADQVAPSHDAQAHAHHDEHAQADGQQADAHLLCHKFCKDQSLTLPHHKGLDAQDFTPTLISLSGPDLGAGPTIAPAESGMMPPHAQGPPLVIRLLRLAL